MELHDIWNTSIYLDRFVVDCHHFQLLLLQEARVVGERGDLVLLPSLATLPHDGCLLLFILTIIDFMQSLQSLLPFDGLQDLEAAHQGLVYTHQST